MHEVAKRVVNKKKIVFPKTLAYTRGDRTELAKGNVKDEVLKLKNQSGKDIMVCGGRSFVLLWLRKTLSINTIY